MEVQEQPIKDMMVVLMMEQRKIQGLVEEVLVKLGMMQVKLHHRLVEMVYLLQLQLRLLLEVAAVAVAVINRIQVLEVQAVAVLVVVELVVLLEQPILVVAVAVLAKNMEEVTQVPLVVLVSLF
jgi:hypothetical protein